MSYQVPQHIDKNKIFIVNRSEIEGRLDAQYYNENLDFSGYGGIGEKKFVRMKTFGSRDASIIEDGKNSQTWEECGQPVRFISWNAAHAAQEALAGGGRRKKTKSLRICIKNLKISRRNPLQIFSESV